MLLFFFVIWVILNGKLTWEVAYTGVALAVPVYLFFCFVTRYTPKRDAEVLKNVPWLLKYFGILLVEIIKANVSVIKLILSPKVEPEPCLKTFRLSFKENPHEVLLANSITLTPGTITVDLSEDDVFTVHALDKDFAAGLEDSVFVRMIKEKEAK